MPEPTVGHSVQVQAAPRPVTPVGLVAELLDRAQDRLDAAGVDEEHLVELRQAARLASGLEPYVEESTSPESSVLAALSRRTREEDWSAGNDEDGGGVLLEQEMLSGHVEGVFLAALVRVSRARRVLEIGMFTGYAALAMAEALPPDGTVVACEIDQRAVAVAEEAFSDSEVGDRVRVEVGPAAATLERLAAVGERFDLVFLDADKPGYSGYLDALLDLDLLAPGALVAVDNTLLQGEPWLEPAAQSANGRAVADFNRRVRADPRLRSVLVPLRDGVTLLWRVDR